MEVSQENTLSDTLQLSCGPPDGATLIAGHSLPAFIV